MESRFPSLVPTAAPASVTLLARCSVLPLAVAPGLAWVQVLTGCGDPVTPPPRGGEGIPLSFSDGGSYQTEGAPQITGGTCE